MREILLMDDTSSLGTAAEINNMGDELGAQNYTELLKYTTIIVATVPVLVIYPFLQKYFVKGIMVGSLKE